MTWTEIQDTLVEIEELQNRCLSQLYNPIIQEIINRHQIYHADLHYPNIKLANNDAVLENKIRIADIQIHLINKIDELKLSANMEEVTQNMPIEIKECEAYIKDVKRNYELANNLCNLILTIEKLAETEYSPKQDFQTSEYAKMSNEQSKYYADILINNGNETESLEKIETILKTNLSLLTTSQKQQLYIEMIALSYDRNAFQYFQTVNTISPLSDITAIPIEVLELSYHIYTNSLTLSMINEYFKAPASKIYEDLKIICDHPIMAKSYSKNN
ncbi:MAG: hypothetical protein PUB18_03240 [bacterium]|nr:hypothetical protein [bacterium]